MWNELDKADECKSSGLRVDELLVERRPMLSHVYVYVRSPTTRGIINWKALHATPFTERRVIHSSSEASMPVGQQGEAMTAVPTTPEEASGGIAYYQNLNLDGDTELPIRKSPVRFGVMRKSGQSSNSWRVWTDTHTVSG